MQFSILTINNTDRIFNREMEKNIIIKYHACQAYNQLFFDNKKIVSLLYVLYKY